MNLRQSIGILTLVSLALACTSKVDRPESILTPEQIERVNIESATPVAGAVLHYVCPNGHSQGGATAGVCPECGDEFTHNQAFHNQANPTTPSTSTPSTSTPSTSTPTNAGSAGVQHYICPNGHSQGGSTAGTCSECGAEFSHNQAFHNTTPSTSTPALTPPLTPPLTNATPEPPQNATGVWHYTCPNGHAGGGGSASPCGECGTPLVHNSAYHN